NTSRIDQVESKNEEQDSRLLDIEEKNKVQDVYIQGLFNENKDGRLTIEGEGNSLKLEGSKEGLVDVNKVVGNTLVNVGIQTDNQFQYKTHEAFTGYTVVANKPGEYIEVDYTSSPTGWHYIKTPYIDVSLFKPSTTYTIVFDKIVGVRIVKICNGQANVALCNEVTINGNRAVFTTYSDISNAVKDTGLFVYCLPTTDIGKKIVGNYYILEGDYSNKPLPQTRFNGMQSTFENQLVTQEMVDSGEELAENLGKYKCEVEVRGKNLCSSQNVNNFYYNSPWSNKIDVISKVIDKDSRMTELIEVKPNTSYAFDALNSNRNGVHFFKTDNEDELPYNGLSAPNKTFTTDNDCKYVRLYIGNAVDVSNIQIVEGTQTTSYEPYYKRKATVYLNSPLHKTDEIVYIDGELKHYHKMGSYLLKHNDDIRLYDNTLTNCNRYGLAMTGYKFKTTGEGCCDKLPYIQNNSEDVAHVRIDGTKPYGALTFWLPKEYGSTVDELKTYMKNNNIEYNLILELAEPYYETIDTDRLLLEIPNNATVSVKSVVPVKSMAASYTNGIPNVYGLQETNQVQDDLINISLLATDEMYTMLEPILESIPQVINNERTMSKMVDMYVAMVIRGLKTIEDVPARYRKEVQDILNKLEK
uniref:CD1375 family protein n=1 Tax=Romboutsia sp. 1001713B170207_170306_H8 TaxID=2787112 RepID=UPI0024345E61